MWPFLEVVQELNIFNVIAPDAFNIDYNINFI